MTLLIDCFKTQVLCLFRYGKAHRSGDDSFEKIACCSQISRRGGTPGHEGPHREGLGGIGQEAEGVRETVLEPLLWFFWEGRNKAQ